MKLGLAIAAAALVGCSAANQAATEYAPIVVNAACQLASDQGSAEPGWEVWICNALDPTTGQPTSQPAMVLHLPKGVVPQTRKQ